MDDAKVKKTNLDLDLFHQEQWSRPGVSSTLCWRHSSVGDFWCEWSNSNRRGRQTPRGEWDKDRARGRSFGGICVISWVVHTENDQSKKTWKHTTNIIYFKILISEVKPEQSSSLCGNSPTGALQQWTFQEINLWSVIWFISRFTIWPDMGVLLWNAFPTCISAAMSLGDMNALKTLLILNSAWIISQVLICANDSRCSELK